MNLLTYLLACDVTDKLIHPSSDYKWIDEMRKKIRDQKAEIKRMEEDYWNNKPVPNVDLDSVFADIDKWKSQNKRKPPTL